MDNSAAWDHDLDDLFLVEDPLFNSMLLWSLHAMIDLAEFRPPDDADRFMAASFDLQARGFDARGDWRGPIWINTDWLLWRGLTGHGRTRVAEEIAARQLFRPPSRRGRRTRCA